MMDADTKIALERENERVTRLQERIKDLETCVDRLLSRDVSYTRPPSVKAAARRIKGEVTDEAIMRSVRREADRGQFH